VRAPAPVVGCQDFQHSILPGPNEQGLKDQVPGEVRRAHAREAQRGDGANGKRRDVGDHCRAADLTREALLAAQLLLAFGEETPVGHPLSLEIQLEVVALQRSGLVTDRPVAEGRRQIARHPRFGHGRRNDEIDLVRNAG
jgi:hypothetical protein